MVPFVCLLLVGEKVHDKNYFLEIALDLGSDRGPSKSDSAESCKQARMRDEKTEPRPAWVPLALTSARVALALVRATPRSTHPRWEKGPGQQATFHFSVGWLCV